MIKKMNHYFFSQSKLFLNLVLLVNQLSAFAEAQGVEVDLVEVEVVVVVVVTLQTVVAESPVAGLNLKSRKTGIQRDR